MWNYPPQAKELGKIDIKFPLRSMDCWSYAVLISEYQPFEFLNIYISLTASDLGFRILTCYLTMLSVWLSDAAPTSLSVFCFCRQHDFGKRKFSERTVLLCDQVSWSITSIFPWYACIELSCCFHFCVAICSVWEGISRWMPERTQHGWLDGDFPSPIYSEIFV
mgnify:CR=1 FL=1